MTDPLHDAERIAALLDGRLPEGQRAEVLARLAASDAAYDAFIDASVEVAATADVAAVDARSQRRRWSIMVGIAAAIIIAVPLVMLHDRQWPTSDETDSRRFAALVSASGRSAVPGDWDATPWTITRGAAEPLTTEARAVRIGARLVELDIAISAGDTNASRIAAGVAALLDPLPASAPVVDIYQRVAAKGATDEMLARGAMAAADLAGRDAVALGAWLQAARIAALRHDTGFFQSTRPPRGAPQVEVTNAPDWSALEQELTAALSRLAS